ncbi:MAG: hypothetical protein IPK72_25625 [Candidatus Eisenbacteria bacterium]|nr:hypothetical protein [Candidatus Eisenbacteria bacterium]
MKLVTQVLGIAGLACTPLSAASIGLSGELLGKLQAVDKVERGGVPITIWKIAVYCDSAYVGQSSTPGSNVELCSPGTTSFDTLDLLDGPIRGVSGVVGEKVFVTYRSVGDCAFITDKWTAWRSGWAAAGGPRSDRDSLAVADHAFELQCSARNFCADRGRLVQLFHTPRDWNSLAMPIPPPGRSWLDFGLMFPRPAVTLEEARNGS